MRQIRFRGKRVDTKEWVYGSLNIIHARKLLPEDVDEYQIHENGMGFFFEVIPETIGQFTGLLDKNGKEIYEGDIFKSAWRVDAQRVTFMSGSFRLNDVVPLDALESIEGEITGTIHD